MCGKTTRCSSQQSHPFTIASTANPDHQHHILSLRVKTRDGITRQLAKRAGRDGTTAVIVEGPYGGLEERLTGFDDVLLIAGGVGGTFVWPIAEHLTRLNRPFRMVWSVKSQGEYSSFTHALCCVFSVLPSFVSSRVRFSFASHFTCPPYADDGRSIDMVHR